MELLELSQKSLKSESKKLYKLINKDFDYDLVIFIARGSFLIGKELADLKKVPLLEVFATRNGGKLKSMLHPILKIIPNNIKKKLREKEVSSGIHMKNIDRKIDYDEIIWKKYRSSKKILLVDDSVDTGFSIKFAKEAIEQFFVDSEIRVAALNCFVKSKDIIKTDFYLYEDTMMRGPWSNDSKENKTYLNLYYKWHDKEGK